MVNVKLDKHLKKLIESDLWAYSGVELIEIIEKINLKNSMGDFD